GAQQRTARARSWRGLPKALRGSMRNWETRGARIPGKKSGSGTVGVQPLEQPGPGVGPQRVGRPGRDPQGRGGLVAGEAGEEAELDQFRRLRVHVGEPVEQVVEFEQVVGKALAGEDRLVQVRPWPAAAALPGFLAAGLLDEDAAHGLGGGGEEVA